MTDSFSAWWHTWLSSCDSGTWER